MYISVFIFIRSFSVNQPEQTTQKKDFNKSSFDYLYYSFDLTSIRRCRELSNGAFWAKKEYKKD